MAALIKKFRRGSKGHLSVSKKRSSSIPDGKAQEISTPTGFKHEWHVGYDITTGEFTGLPDAWNMWLQKSNIRWALTLSTEGDRYYFLKCSG